MPRPVRQPARSDGTDTRERLVRTALRLFAEQGFANTSTREISEAAGVNLASIGYYFGDKAGLYRAAFFEPLGDDSYAAPLIEHASLGETLAAFYRDFLAPLKQGEVVRQCMRLHFREMVDPVGVWDEVVERELKPQHAALVRLLAHHLGMDAGSVEVHRLAFAMIGMAVHMFVARDVMLGIRADAVDSPDAIDAMAARLALYAEAMVEVEGRRRPVAAPRVRRSR